MKKTSKYTGVHFATQEKKWVAKIRKDGKQKYIGIFSDEIEAAKAYNHWAIKYYQDEAKLNAV